jgi:hypothetical protein
VQQQQQALQLAAQLGQAIGQAAAGGDTAGRTYPSYSSPGNQGVASASQPIFQSKQREPIATGAQGNSGACAFNTDCTYPASCVKAPGARTGICGVEVDSTGLRTYKRTGVGVACMWPSDCGVGFRCERETSSSSPGVCVSK